MDYIEKEWVCPLEDSRACRILHMSSCKKCPVNTEKDADRLELLVDRFETLADGKAIAALAASKECSFCRGEKRNKADAVGLWDIGYPMPREITKKPRRKGIFSREEVAYELILPLQFPVCKSCRRKILLCSYLPMIIAIAGLGLALLLVGIESSARVLRSLWRGLPLVTLLVLGWGGYIAGRIWARALEKRFRSLCYMDPCNHPLGKELLERRWQSILRKREDKLLFTKKRLKWGLGTAPVEAYREEK